MAHTKSAKKRLRQNEKRRLRNRFYVRTARNAMKKLKKMVLAGDIESAEQFLPRVYQALDKAHRAGALHKNTVARYKSRITAYLNRAKSAQTA